ncbi:M15 family metallopeptidase [Mycobacteroides abscessus subsp. abscessus]|uniref:M15 family metallopeptidase n=2 Tax=Mycobacteroides abscessus TaxID=36809 RepID=UPI0019CF640C|nr:M15 family metallopeptidase [Mycobacteroides abscessus]MBN7386165.1 M15 family metallopeptidase [Mycobacteroides abscessus subsp. abscessus]MBN7418934.1 M15 family metallopeptidase [Mycobacteroides abscessus subsp. abscessus]
MITENGWPSCDSSMLERNPIPGTTIVIPLQRGIPNRIMKAFAADFHAFVESLYNSRGGTDEGGWTPTNSVATSNHIGGTAMDLNWSDHPMGKAYDGYSSTKIATVRELLAFYTIDGLAMMYWGNDWNSPKDSMHFQMGYNTYNNQAKCNDFIKRKIRADGFSTFRRGPQAPANPDDFPLPQGYCFGPLDGPDYCISGEYPADLQSWKDGLGRWQAALGLPATKRWDDATRDAATVLQKQRNWPSNPDFGYGGVYLAEWNEVITKGWRLPVKDKKFPDYWTDRELMIETLRQLRGPDLAGWPQLGNASLVDAVAQVRAS